MSSRFKSWLPIAALLVLALLFVVLGGGGRDTGRPLDPASTGELGTRGLVLLLEELDANVSISNAMPGSTADVALLMSDDLAPADRQALRRWVEAGGTLVVADAFSDFAPLLARADAGLFDDLDTDPSPILVPACDLPLLDKVTQIEVASPEAFDTPPTAVGCFPIGDGHRLVARAEGAGTVIALVAPDVFVNSWIGVRDNAVLAVSLLAPVGGTAVHIIEPPAPGEGRATLRELIRPSIRSGLLQLVVAFVFFAVWRARRLGPPVAEALPVDVPGSELVVAVGHLLQKSRRREQAAAMIRYDLRRVLGRRLGLGPDAPRDVLVRSVSVRSSLEPARIEEILFDSHPANDDDLVELAASLDNIRSEVLHV
ncbi:MAG: DUF4350 domain-containing protein [Acidimicrobiales bacterium]